MSSSGDAPLGRLKPSPGPHVRAQGSYASGGLLRSEGLDTVPNAGRKALLWGSVFLTGYFATILFERLYLTWLVWQGGLPYGGTPNFWDTEYGLEPIVAGEILALAAAVAMVAWNFRSRRETTTEATYLFWVGLGVMAYFGSLLVVGLTMAGASWSGWTFENWLEPAVPFVIGLSMVVVAIGQTISRHSKERLAATS